jgi:hypothetical protein
MIKNEYDGDYMTFYTKGLGLTKEEIDAFREKLIVK